eukprot:CAMPEP_0198228226 /NCGR_PEP_ID=MMETSP1445-20131203/112382_1 /TAXON_ID=36898 /ORGANISM="Pyramimonas sp., Strain CCMP2087" /LENGTH=59 /DNA_ID=CAMNT_0043908527 /DNA_START=168 /DNA_END=344 /DNA_ORIENTATION=+
MTSSTVLAKMLRDSAGNSPRLVMKLLITATHFKLLFTRSVLGLVDVHSLERVSISTTNR